MCKRYDWQTLLTDSVYSSFPEAAPKPVIGITGNYGDGLCKIAEGYYKSVVKAGGVPVIIPPLSDTDAIVNTLDRLDGLVLSGGSDYDPRYAGEEPSPKLGDINAERDLPELFITRLAYNRRLPILGICRGIQTLAMALGGHVAQDLSEARGDAIHLGGVAHSQQADRSVPTHTVMVEDGSTLFNIYRGSHQTPTLHVNSLHHQCVDDAGPRFRVTARAEDGIVEAIESTEFRSILGVQWHPECLSDGLPLFLWLVGAAREYREVCRVHHRLLTLDSHCDTPMFFPQQVEFSHREPRLCVDLHKMTEGRQDATIMVAYLPQDMPAEACPKAYADAVFDKIEDIVARNSRYIALARTPDDLWANKHRGRKSIMLGIENGHALEGSIDNLRHFARRGIVYMTLCHNGDNDICDSARGSATHGGVSAFGRQVIGEMNRLGVMVDLSHAAETSFYDALQLSSTPIVCSHSSCRSLCNHPRNLTDDQMRALAQRGGVMQVTLYHGFLVENGPATLDDALRHLEHAIDVMGIDHVGIGTDFDGDGGVSGLADSSELPHLTRELLRRGYDEDALAKIWGGNFLRVMRQVQNSKES